MTTLKTITLDGIEYIRADSVAKSAKPSFEGYEYKIVRSDRAGVFAGYLKKLEGQMAEVLEARRIFYWSGAASLSQLAIDGTSKPNDCKFPEAVSKILLTDVIEVIDVTAKAKASIDGVKIWKV